MDPYFPLFSIFSFVCFVLVLSPLPWHLQTWNIGTCMYMIWTGTSCLIWFVDSLIWRNNAIDWAPVYCDISAGIAIPACSLCIQRHLFFITTMKVTGSSAREKLRMVITDAGICLGFPLCIIGLSYTAQGSRYMIFEDIGCTIPINDIWPSVLTLRAFYSRRLQINEFITSDACPMTSQRYTRLMILASTEVAFTIPFSAWVLYRNIENIQPYISWNDTHSYFGVISTFPSIIWRNDRYARIYCEFGRWSFVMCAIVFIGFFTFAEESRRKYYNLFDAVAKRFGWSLPTEAVPKRGNDTLPPMFPSHKTNEVTTLSSITTGGMDDMTEREQTPASSRIFDSSSTIVVPDPEMDLGDTPYCNTVTLSFPPPFSANVEGVR
ncbi:STE3-domain-containing protein [Rickenella mellea]|uniref:STE3-domain-containing protein n=1 Tax=Rickenella mellea TaxID=50990 RepID=A0A4Y7PVY9_9AGAM|nr:STE3-domain-containing protein [Rickenella mellea]